MPGSRTSSLSARNNCAISRRNLVGGCTVRPRVCVRRPNSLHRRRRTRRTHHRRRLTRVGRAGRTKHIAARTSGQNGNINHVWTTRYATFREHFRSSELYPSNLNHTGTHRRLHFMATLVALPTAKGGKMKPRNSTPYHFENRPKIKGRVDVITTTLRSLVRQCCRTKTQSLRNLSLRKLSLNKTRLTRISFQQTGLAGTRLFRTGLARVGNCRTVLTLTSLHRTSLTRTILVRTSLRGIRNRHTALVGTSLHHDGLDRTSLDRTGLRKTGLTKTSLDRTGLC